MKKIVKENVMNLNAGITYIFKKLRGGFHGETFVLATKMKIVEKNMCIYIYICDDLFSMLCMI